MSNIFITCYNLNEGDGIMLNISVQRLNKEYIRNDCVQVQFNFTEGMKLEDEDYEVLFKLKPEDNDYVNKYLTDERRIDFPYGNIPIHRKRINGEDYNSVNQILEYNKIYNCTRYYKAGLNDVIEKEEIYYKAIKDGDSALILAYDSLSPEFSMSAEQIKNLETMKRLHIVKTNNPRISRIYNKKIPREEIRKAKKLAKEKRTK